MKIVIKMFCDGCASTVVAFIIKAQKCCNECRQNLNSKGKNVKYLKIDKYKLCFPCSKGSDSTVILL